MTDQQPLEHQPDHKISVTFVGINYVPEPTGIAPYATRFCSGMAERGYEVRVVTGVPHHPQWRVSPEYRRAPPEGTGQTCDPEHFDGER